MVAPSSGVLKSIIDEIATQLDDVTGLRVYKYPADSIQEFPAALIRDNQASNQTAVAEFRTTTPKVVYNLEVLVIVALSDEQEAYEELEQYISATARRRSKPWWIWLRSPGSRAFSAYAPSPGGVSAWAGQTYGVAPSG